MTRSPAPAGPDIACSIPAETGCCFGNGHPLSRQKSRNFHHITHGGIKRAAPAGDASDSPAEGRPERSKTPRGGACVQAQPAKKQPPYWVTAFMMLASLIVPGRYQPSIFSADELNFRVRNGNGCTLTAINANCSSFINDLLILPHILPKSKGKLNFF